MESSKETRPLDTKLFNDYRNRNVLCDVTLKVQDKLFPVHRVFLAVQSKYFEGLLTTPMLEASQQEIEIKDMSSATFEDLLNHMYGNDVSLHTENIHTIMIAADRFCVDTLVRKCKDFFKNNWMKMTASDVTFLAEHFRLESVQKEVAEPLGYFRGSGEMPDCLNVSKSFVVMAMEDKGKLIHPTVALEALNIWLWLDTSTLPSLTELFPLYPLEKIPVQAVKDFIENPRMLPEVQPKLKDLYTASVQNYKNPGIMIFQVQNDGTLYDINRFDFDTFTWVPAQSVPETVEQVIPFAEGYCILTTNQIYEHLGNGGDDGPQAYDVPTYDNRFCIMRNRDLVIVHSDSDNTEISEMELINNPIRFRETEATIQNVYKPGVVANKDILYLVGGNHFSEVTTQSDEINCQACYCYNFETRKLCHLAYLYVPISRPVVCIHEDYLIILKKKPDDSGIILLHCLNLSNYRIEFYKLEIMYYVKNKEHCGWTSVKLLAAGVEKREMNTLVLVFSVKADKKPTEFMIGAATIKCKARGNRLNFGKIRPEIFLATEGNPIASFAFVRNMH